MSDFFHSSYFLGSDNPFLFLMLFSIYFLSSFTSTLWSSLLCEDCFIKLLKFVVKYFYHSFHVLMNFPNVYSFFV